MAFNPEVPYNDLPLLPPKQDYETKAVLKKLAAAARALGELKGSGQTIPNQSLLVDSIVFQEAKDSSAIENIVTTNDTLYKAFVSSRNNIDSATKEVLRYRESLWAGFNELKRRRIISTNLFISVVQTIRNNQAGIRNVPGTVIKNEATNEIVYTPPVGEEVIRNKLHNLEKFIHAEDDIDPLIKLAMIHYQFEAIHPFFDGNGRTGRVLNILYLIYAGLLELPVLYLSRYIIEHKTQYYSLIRNVTENNDWEAWILYMLDAVEKSTIFTHSMLISIRELMLNTMERAKQELPSKVYSKELLEVIFEKPYTKVQFLIERNIAKRQTASEYLKELVKIGILTPHKQGRETLFLNTELMNLLSK